MAPVKWLRTLIAVEIGLILLTLLASVRLEHTLPAPLQTYLREYHEAPMTRLEAVVGTLVVFWAALKVVSWTGLYLRWRVAPWLYLASWIAVVAIDLSSGPSIETAVETTLTAAWSVVGGAILVMSLQALRKPARPADGAGAAP
jgi:hypothetical protein